MAASSRSPFGHSLRSCPLSRTRGQLLGGVTASLPCRGWWMRAKRADGGVAAWLLLFTSTPQSIRLAAYCQLPGRGVFGRYTQTLVQSRRAANDGPYSTSYKPLAKTRGRTASTISSQSLTLTRRKADFTLRKQYFTARQRNFTRSQERISPRAEARYISLSSASPYSLCRNSACHFTGRELFSKRSAEHATRAFLSLFI